MIDWIYDHGTWRWRSPAGAYYRVEYRGGKWYARINRSTGCPWRLGHFESANEAKSACAAHAANAAGTVDRERGMNLSVR